MEINKIIAAIIVTVVIVVGIGKVSDWIYEVNQPAQAAYKVEASENSTNDTKKSENGIDLSSFIALGDASHGEKVFKKCKACHSIKKTGKNKIGPALWGVMARNAGDLTDYKYSKALVSYGKQWTFGELNGFLLKPASWVKGNKMGFAGIKNDKDRASVILFLNQNSDSPLDLP